MPKSVLARLEEAVRLCDEAIARLETDPDPARPALLEEIRVIRAEQIKHIERLREAIGGSTAVEPV